MNYFENQIVYNLEIKITLDNKEAEMKDTENQTVIKNSKDEIEIDLKEPTPLSKKEKRLLKKGKVDKIPKKKLQVKEIKLATEEDEGSINTGKEGQTQKNEIFSVWIGNLSFDTTEEELKTFIINKSVSQLEDVKNNEGNKLVEIREEDMVRVKMPKQKGSANKIKGFAYIDFSVAEKAASVVSMSESFLNGRNLLIKDSKNFEGRPAISKFEEKKFGEPTRILFVGNLSFETLEEDLEKHFRHCGEIFRIRMATFEDSGKCKGFAFIDFTEIESVTRALKDRLCQKLMGRTLKLQYGEDRSKRAPKNFSGNKRSLESQENAFENHSANDANSSNNIDKSNKGGESNFKKQKKQFTRSSGGNGNRMKSSVALANAQRASAAIVKSTGKKISFD